ncbi:hypothetical protein AAVH_34282 [Aphelenchoides avenae]|nr:hypothetical protein AAVH_34282 [Aphelenchus avenae]
MIFSALVCYGEHEIWDDQGCDHACGGGINCTETPRCVCEYNYARDEYNFCIPAEECPKPSTTTESSTTTAPISTTTGACPVNEIWDLDGCDEKCTTGINCTFVPQCVCDVKYARDSSGRCVERDDCPHDTTTSSVPTTTTAPGKSSSA